MANTNFDNLLKRYLKGETSEEETIKIEAWLDIMKTENTDNLELSEEDEEKLFRKITARKDNLREIEQFQPWKKSLTPTDWTLRIAAGLLLLCVVSFSIWYLMGTGNNSFQVADEVEKIILEDGTLVWLRGGGSTLTYKQAEGIRFTELQGEALFEVAKDPAHPFVIQCGEVSLKVLGTSFSVKTSHDSLEVKVLTGKVNLSLENDAEGIMVEPNEKVTYVRKGKLEKHSFDKVEIQKVIANTEYNMQFRGVTLAQAVEKLQKKFDIAIILENKQIGQCRITVDLTDRSLESSLKMITEVLDVQYLQDDNTITIQGSGCE